MKPAPFEYHRATSLADAVEVLGRSPEDTKILAGGQSLIPLLNFRLARPALLVDIWRLPLRTIQLHPGGLLIGALATHEEVRRSSLVANHAPLLAEALGHVGHAAIRTRGTVGGSLAHADPAGEAPAVALALKAKVVATSAAGERRIPVEELLVGRWTTSLEPDEILTAVEFPGQPPGTRSGFAEFRRRSGDFALAGACVVIRPTCWRLVIFGVGARPVAGNFERRPSSGDVDVLINSVAPTANGWQRSTIAWTVDKALQDADG